MAECFSSKILRRINKELNVLRTNPLEGIRVLINEDDITDLRAWIRGPAETPYQNGSFKICIRFGPEYPSTPPNCTFSTKIFHPNVGPKGEICVNTLKKDWTSNQTLTEILTVVKCLLIYPNPESALDEEAGRLLLENYDEYRQRAKLWTDIHAKIKPVGLFDGPNLPLDSSNSLDSHISSTTVTTSESKQTSMLPFASSNQVNHNQNMKSTKKIDEHTMSNSNHHQELNDNLLKSNHNNNDFNLILNNNAVEEGENIVPSPLDHNTKVPIPALLPTHKDKDRRGRKRL